VKSEDAEALGDWNISAVKNGNVTIT